MNRRIICILVFVGLALSSCGYSRFIRIPQTSSIYPAVPDIKISYKYSAGAAKSVITPSSDTWLAGFFPWRRANGVDDDLEARALALIDTSGEIFVFVSVDLLGFMRNDVDVLRKKIDAPNIHIFVMSSHTHSGPDTIGYWGAMPFTSGRDENYISEVIDVMQKTIFDAIKNSEPVDIYQSSVQVENMTKNRREAFLDGELSVLLFRNPSIGNIGAIVNFGCHPEVLKENNRKVSSDFVGAMRNYIDSEYHTTTLFMNGALGGMVQPDMKWNSDESIYIKNKFGENLGRASIFALATIDFQKPLPVQRVEYMREVVDIPLYNRKFFLAALLGLMPHRGVFVSGGYIATEVNVLRVGGTNIVMIPGEIVPELGLIIKQMGGPGTQVWGLANDEIGYILNEEKFDSKTFKYERTMSLGHETGSIIMRSVKSLINK